MDNPEEFDLNKYSNSSKGCVLEMDLEYRKRIMRITQWLSFSSKQNRNEKRNAVWVSIKDKWFLQCFFFDNEKYAIHYKNIQLYFRLGCKLKKKKHALEFNKSQWLKPYIEFNTHKKTSRKE